METTKSSEFIRIIKFTLFSISAGIVQIAVFTLLNELFSSLYWPNYLISLTASVIWNFTFNRKFTFQSANNVPIAMLKVFGYYAVFTPLSTWWGNALTSIHWNEYLVLGITMIANFLTEFIFDRYLVFGKSIDSSCRNYPNN
jgi:putative flippase GtrA